MYDYYEIQVHIERAKRMRAEALNELIDGAEAKVARVIRDCVKRLAAFVHAHGSPRAKQERLA